MKFSLKETPKIRKDVILNLNKIVVYLEEKIPNSAIGLWGSFSYGEGRVKKVNGTLKYQDDMDIFIYTNSLVKYLKWHNKIKNLGEKLNINAEVCVWVKCIPLIRLGLSFCGFPKMLNKKKLDMFKEKRFPQIIESTKYLLESHQYMFRFITTKNRENLIKAYIRLYRSLEIYDRKNKEVFSLKNNLKSLEKYRKELTKQQNDILKSAIKIRLGMKSKTKIDFSSIFKMKSLFEKMFYKLNNKNGLFIVRYQLIIWKYLFFNKKPIKILINFNKQRLAASNYLLNSITEKKRINDEYLKKAEYIVTNILSEKPRTNSKEKRFKWVADKLWEIYK
ncbi:MAG: hypothetical protein H8D38_06110 [DPANN group archaeon]|nr:hypothetical protein [DPANN group archaeon]